MVTKSADHSTVDHIKITSVLVAGLALMAHGMAELIEFGSLTLPEEYAMFLNAGGPFFLSLLILSEDCVLPSEV